MAHLSCFFGTSDNCELFPIDVCRRSHSKLSRFLDFHRLPSDDTGLLAELLQNLICVPCRREVEESEVLAFLRFRWQLHLHMGRVRLRSLTRWNSMSWKHSPRLAAAPDLNWIPVGKPSTHLRDLGVQVLDFFRRGASSNTRNKQPGPHHSDVVLAELFHLRFGCCKKIFD